MDATPKPQAAPRFVYSRWARARGLIAATIISYLLSMQLMMGGSHFEGFPDFSRMFAWTPLALPFAIVGIPAAGFVALAIGYPVWQWFMDKGRSGFGDAARAGAIVGAVVLAAELPVTLGSLLSQIGQPPTEYVRHAGEGLSPAPQAFLWLRLLGDGLCTIVIGILCGVVARAAAGAPRQDSCQKQKAQA